MSWESITLSTRREVIEDKLTQIEEILRKIQVPSNNPGLMGGKTGIALFNFFYAKLINKQDHYDCGIELLSSVFEEINNGYSFQTHAGGLAGIGAVIEILKQEDFIDVNTEELLGEIDIYLYELMLKELENKRFDFLHGATGIAFYFLKRLPNKYCENYLVDFVCGLEKIAIKDDQGIRWLSVLNREKNTTGYNLSLSHGLSSIIAFLSKIYAAEIEQEKVLELLDGSVKYLLNQQQDTAVSKSNFPSWVCESEPNDYSRIAWCYGDLGIGIALWLAGNNTGNEQWKCKAIDIVSHSTKRKIFDETGVVDAGICHGAAGVAHIYNRMYQFTGNDQFKEAALYWFDQTLKMAIYEDGLAGYKAWRTPEHGGFQNEYGFLEGVAGIGLTLIGAISDISPAWDECLLLS